MRTRTPISEADILAALRQCDWELRAAAHELDISVRTLYRRMAEYGIRGRVQYELVKERR